MSSAPSAGRHAQNLLTQHVSPVHRKQAEECFKQLRAIISQAAIDSRPKSDPHKSQYFFELMNNPEAAAAAPESDGARLSLFFYLAAEHSVIFSLLYLFFVCSRFRSPNRVSLSPSRQGAHVLWLPGEPEANACYEGRRIARVRAAAQPSRAASSVRVWYCHIAFIDLESG
jgi:hypothetical protein